MLNPHQPAFDSELLSELPRLRHLELVGFGPIYLDYLPASLRTLRSLGGQVTDECLLTREPESGCSPFLLSFPEHCWYEGCIDCGPGRWWRSWRASQTGMRIHPFPS